MKKICTIILLTYYSFGMIFLPMGNFAFVNHLPEMYEQCKEEDPDMNLPDFVFEHFLNLEDVIAHFEQKDETEEGEKPHQPYTQDQIHNQLILTAPKISVWVSKENFILEIATIIYPLRDDCYMPSAYLPGIFRPPII